MIDSTAKQSNALALAEMDFHIFPCIANAKLPLLKAYPVMASRDPATIEKWGRKYPGCNWGISTSRFGDDKALLVIDVDCKNGKNGDATLDALESDGFAFPLTLQTRTPTGGRHLFYTVDAPVKQGVDVLGVGLDVRSQGGYVVAPGSVVDAGEYFTDRPSPPVAAPAWLIDRCGVPRTRSTTRTPLPGVDPARAEKRAIEWLATAERSTKGAGGDQAAYRVAAKLLALGLDAAATLDMMLSEHWDDGCGWSADRLQQKVEHAKRYMLDTPGADAPEAVFPLVEPTEQTYPELPAWVVNMNDRFFVVNEAGKPIVIRPMTDPIFRRRHFERSTFDDLTKLYLNRKVPGTNVNLARKWLGHTGRRDYLGGLVFAPGKTVASDQFNLWQGFGVEPTAGDWSLLRDHTRDVICQGNIEVFEYLMNWMARAVQEPSKQGETAVVMQSGEGTGKGVLARAMVTIFGQHGMQLTQAKHVTSNFNAHMRDLCFLFGDEAFFAADRSHAGVLKALITEPTLTIEGKFQNAVTVPNMLHIMLASNDKWVVPAGKDDRRYLVLEVSEAQKNNPEYFKPLYAQLDDGGYAAMLHELLARDIKAFNVRRVPSTKAHIEQKRMSLRGVDRWLDECLQNRRIGAQEWTSDGVVIATSHAYDDYFVHHSRRDRFPEGIEQWSKAIGKTFGAEFLSRSRPRVGAERVTVLKFAGIEQCRAAFGKSLGTSNAEWMDSEHIEAAAAVDIFS